MALEHINPEGISRPTSYTHVVRASGGATVYVSGQVAIDASGNLVGAGDFEAQARQVFANLRTALASVGATFDDVAKMNTYIVDYTPELRSALSAARADAMGEHPPASTLIGVQALATPELMIEVEAVAVLD
jgi:enamine deaminase RidA (YjgF/YER057c/UK114 family)